MEEPIEEYAHMVEELDHKLSSAIARLRELDEEEEQRQKTKSEFNALVGQLLETLPDALIVVDATGTIFLANAQSEFLFGYHRSEMIGQKVEVLVADRYRPNHVEHREAYSMQPHVRTMGVGMQLWGRHKSGTEVPVQIMLAPLMTINGLYNLALIRRTHFPGQTHGEVVPQVVMTNNVERRRS